MHAHVEEPLLELRMHDDGQIEAYLPGASYPVLLVQSLAMLSGEITVPAMGVVDCRGSTLTGDLKFFIHDADTPDRMWISTASWEYADRVQTAYINPAHITGLVDEALRFQLVDTEWGKCNTFSFAHAMAIVQKVDELQLLQIQANAQVLFSANDLNRGRWYLPTPDEDDSRLWLGSYGEGTLKVVVPTHRPGNFSNRYITLIHA